jgi:hypothetical protein
VSETFLAASEGELGNDNVLDTTPNASRALPGGLIRQGRTTARRRSDSLEVCERTFKIAAAAGQRVQPDIWRKTYL